MLLLSAWFFVWFCYILVPVVRSFEHGSFVTFIFAKPNPFFFGVKRDFIANWKCSTETSQDLHNYRHHNLTAIATNTSNHTITPQRPWHSNKTKHNNKIRHHTQTSDSQILASFVYTAHCEVNPNESPKIALRQKHRTCIIENFMFSLICSFLSQQVSTPIGFPPNLISFDHLRSLQERPTIIDQVRIFQWKKRVPSLLSNCVPIWNPPIGVYVCTLYSKPILNLL